jgi:FdhD protein
MPDSPADPQRHFDVVRIGGDRRERVSDVAAVEEPLQVRVHGEPFAVIMRTPGADMALAAGFLFSERVIRAPDEIGTMRYCTDEDVSVAEARGNVIDVTLSIPDPSSRLDARRRVITNASCGVCGRATLDGLRGEAPPIDAAWSMPAALIAALPARLRGAQDLFDRTGGLHAAGLFTCSGDLELAAEDVGRHNAVDKVIGRMLLADRLPLASTALVVSGRTSFEIIQKAYLAGIPLVAAVSAPSSLAIDLAQESGMTLLGFVRAGSLNIYTHPQRIT